jgi:adenylate kinase family enzyme
LKGTGVWILSLFSVISGANIVNALIMWFNLGPEGMFTPYVLGSFIGPIPVYFYLFLSALMTAVFLGGTSHKILTELSYADQINAFSEEVYRLENSLKAQQQVLETVQARVFLVDESLEHTRKHLSNGLIEQGNVLKQSIESGYNAQQKTLEVMQEHTLMLDKNMSSIKKTVKEQTDAAREMLKNYSTDLGPQLDSLRVTLQEQRERVDTALAEVELKERDVLVASIKHRDELKEIRLKLEILERNMAEPETLLMSKSGIEEIKGIGYGRGAELKEIGITNVGEFISADSKVVSDMMGSSEKTVERLQGRAQLSMVPGVKENHLSLLEELGIRDRKSLSEQDPIELSKKINAIFGANVAKGKVSPADKPTIEEIDSWVKFSKS